jgi:hypothetical protein
VAEWARETIVTTSPLHCFLCGGDAVLHPSAAAELRIDCEACGEYAITWGAANRLKEKRALAESARAYVAAQHAAGERRPFVTTDMTEPSPG